MLNYTLFIIHYFYASHAEGVFQILSPGTSEAASSPFSW